MFSQTTCLLLHRHWNYTVCPYTSWNFKWLYVLTLTAVFCADRLFYRQREWRQLHSCPSTRSSRPGHILHALLFLAFGDCSILLLTRGEATHAHINTGMQCIHFQSCGLSHMNDAASGCQGLACPHPLPPNHPYTCFYKFVEMGTHKHVNTHIYPSLCMTHYQKIKSLHSSKRTDSWLAYYKANFYWAMHQ